MKKYVVTRFFTAVVVAKSPEEADEKAAELRTSTDMLEMDFHEVRLARQVDVETHEWAMRNRRS